MHEEEKSCGDIMSRSTSSGCGRSDELESDLQVGKTSSQSAALQEPHLRAYDDGAKNRFPGLFVPTKQAKINLLRKYVLYASRPQGP